MSFLKPSAAPKKRVYADAAASTPISARARRELSRLLPLYGNPGALHAEGVSAKKELERARASVAASVGAHADEIVFTASGTESNNLAIQGLLREGLTFAGLRRSDLRDIHAITSEIEHPSVLEPLRALKRDGLELTELPVDREGFVSPKELAENIKDNTVFILIQFINSEVGTVQPIKEIAKEIRKSGKKIYLHCDASQAPLWMKMNVEQLHVDLMTLDAQKILGPKGVGALYIKRGTPIEAVMRGGWQERGLRGGTENVPLAGAFAAALQDARSGAEKRARKIGAVRDYLWNEIKKLLPDAILHGPRIARVANNLNVSIPGLDGDMAVIEMDAVGIAISTRSACSTGDEKPSHVLKALGTSDKSVKEAIRITLLPDATRAEARRIASGLADVVSRYRQK